MTLYIKQKEVKKIATKTKIRKNIFSKATGLMFHKKIKDEAHIFKFKKPKIQTLTMFFVFFKIDVIFTKENKIVEIKENFKPFTNYKTKTKADTFIELPEKTIKRNNIKIGNKIIIKNNHAK